MVELISITFIFVRHEDHFGKAMFQRSESGEYISESTKI